MTAAILDKDVESTYMYFNTVTRLIAISRSEFHAFHATRLRFLGKRKKEKLCQKVDVRRQASQASAFVICDLDGSTASEMTGKQSEHISIMLT